ncbi:hypothetical protein C8R47DRAFT_176686 [Mycena vitilis]|nr:hypothetical protein C8R47DRAFT_176686 [Mycena vitilis]
MPLFESASSFQINDGNFVDVGGDLNLHIAPHTKAHNNDPLPLDALGFAIGETSRQLVGLEDNTQRLEPASMSAYDNHSPSFEHEFGAPASFERVGITGPDSCVLTPQSDDMIHGPMFSRYIPPFPASVHDIPRVHHDHPATSVEIRQPVPTAQIFSQPSASGHPPAINLIAPTPRPSIDHNGLQRFDYRLAFSGPSGDTSQPFAGNFRGENSLAPPIINSALWDSLPNGPKTNINVSGNMNNINRHGESGFHILHHAVASDAFHDAAARYPKPRCHPETRTEMLQDLHEWSCQLDFGSSILWLYGPAGAGKSAITQSFCQMLEAEHRLGAGFFFKRGHPSRGSGNKLFLTIAYQLARSRPDLKRAISEIVEEDPSIVDRDLSVQVAKLIIEPCQRSPYRTRSLVVVIDGLDECEGQHIQQEILCSLDSIVCKQPLPFRILIASRPEPHIQELFQGLLNEVHRPLNINQSFEDVHIYLVDEFRRIHQSHRETMGMVAKPWPSYNIIEKLTDKSSGYFIYASTVIRFVDDRDFRPTERLDVIMGIHMVESETPFAALDQLYIQILSAVPISRHHQLLEVLAVIAAKFNLSSLHIEQLLGLQPGDSRFILRHMHSVLHVPHNTGERIIVHHVSFLDFLDDPTRSGAFHIGQLQRTNLACHILTALSLNVDPSADHVAWQLEQVHFEYVTSIQPLPDVVLLLYTLNTDFLDFPNVHYVVRKVLSWLKMSRPLPHNLIQLWEDYQTIITSGVHSPSRMKIRSEGIAGELELHRCFPQVSAQLVKIMFTRVRRPFDSVDLSPLAASDDLEAKDLINMDPSTIEDLASSMYHFGHLQGTAARTLSFNQEAVYVYRKLAEKDPTIIKDLAGSLHNLGVDLRNTGQSQAAVCTDEEAVALCRKLTKTNPTVTKDLARSLHNLGVDLNNSGQYELAVHANEEAVELYDKLVETDPSVTKDLANSLHNLGIDLCNTRQYGVAVNANETAVRLRQKLMETDPSITKDLANSLHNLSVNLSNTGQHEAAMCAGKEAVQLRRKLAAADPAVIKDLADSLHNLGVDLRNTQQYEAAVRNNEEVIDIRRKLAETDPTATTDLASSLNNLGVDLRKIGRHKDALSAHTEAVELRRKLAKTDPIMTKDLVISLHNLCLDICDSVQYEAAVCTEKKVVEFHCNGVENDSFITKNLSSSLHNSGSTDLHRRGQYVAAVSAGEEAVELCRKLADMHPSCTKDLADALYIFGAELALVDCHNDVVQVTEEAVSLYRGLTRTEPSVIKDLADSLITLRADLWNVGQYKAALCADKEAVELRRKLAETDSAGLKDLADSLHNLGVDLWKTGQECTALCAHHEAVLLRRKLAKTDPNVTRDLISSLQNLGITLRAVTMHTYAVRTEEEVIKLLCKLVETDFSLAKDLAQSMYNLSCDLRYLGLCEHAVNADEQTVAFYRQLVETDPSLTKNFASSLHGLGVDLHAVGRYKDAVCANAEAVELRRKLAEMHPIITKDLASSLHNLGIDLLKTGQYEAALQADKEAVRLRRKLAETDSSIAVDLASSLHNLGCDLHTMGHHEDAVQAHEEAVKLRHKLAEKYSAVTVDLASSLHNLGCDLRTMGRHEDAVRAHEEAVKLRHKLAETDSAVTVDLASSLHSLGCDLRTMGRHEDAVRAHEEAVKLRHKLAETDSSVTVDLANSLHNLGIDLYNSEQYEAAWDIEEEAVQLHRKLAKTEPTMAIDLASSLHYLGCDLHYAGQHEAAVRIKEEAVELRHKLAQRDPTISEDLAASLFSLGYSLRVIGRHRDALFADAEAAEFHRQLMEKDPAVAKHLAGSLKDLALNLNAVGRFEDAASVAEEAAQYYSQLPDIAESEQGLANILVHRATYLRALGRQEDSVHMGEQGGELHRKLSEKEPESAADLLQELAEDFSTTGLHEDALCAVEKSVQLYRTLTPTKPALTKYLMEALGYRARSLHALGRDEDAMHTDSEIAELRCAESQSKDAPVPVGPVEPQNRVADVPDAEVSSPQRGDDSVDPTDSECVHEPIQKQ